MYICMYVCMYLPSLLLCDEGKNCRWQLQAAWPGEENADSCNSFQEPAVNVFYNAARVLRSPETNGSGVLIRRYLKNQLLCVLHTPANSSKLYFETGTSTNRYCTTMNEAHSDLVQYIWEEWGPTSKKSTTPQHGLSFHQSVAVRNADV
jgi:hypothetical protein